MKVKQLGFHYLKKISVKSQGEDMGLGAQNQVNLENKRTFIF